MTCAQWLVYSCGSPLTCLVSCQLVIFFICCCCSCCRSLWYWQWNLMKAKPFKLFSLLFLSTDLYDTLLWNLMKTHCGIWWRLTVESDEDSLWNVMKTHCEIWWRLTVESDEDSLWNLMKTKPFKLLQLVTLFYWSLWCAQSPLNFSVCYSFLLIFMVCTKPFKLSIWNFAADKVIQVCHQDPFVFLCHLSFNLFLAPGGTWYTHLHLMNIYSYLCAENIEQQSRHVLVL